MIVVVGLSHRTASIEVREKMALAEDTIAPLLRDLASADQIGEAMVLSTCNRVEIVAAPPSGSRSDLGATAAAVVSRLSAVAPGVQAHLYSHVGADAVRHLFRVAASLDSLVLGEPQILGQVKDAFDAARSAGTLGPSLNRLVPRALRVAKRVRTETAIGAGQVSVPSVAVDLARQIFGEIGGCVAALVGSGEIAESVARLLGRGGARILVAGRRVERAEEVARGVGGEPRTMTDLDAILAEAAIVVTATGAGGILVDADRVGRARRARRGRPLFLIDLSVPRNVDPRAGELDGVFLYNIDDLSRVVGQSASGRLREAERAEQIVGVEAAGYDRWVDGEQATPTLVTLRERIRAILDAEIERSLKGRLRHLGEEDREALSKMREAVLNKLLHAPTARLREIAADASLRAERMESYVSALTDLFSLGADPDSAPEVASNVDAEPSDAAGDESAASGGAARPAGTR